MFTDLETQAMCYILQAVCLLLKAPMAIKFHSTSSLRKEISRSKCVRRRSAMNFNFKFMYVFKILMLLAAAVTQEVVGKQYKVGDLDAWGIPTSANPHVYTTWPKNHSFKIGDSLLFLYPPSQDSVIQVSEGSFKSCTLENPIMYMDDGNSIFNITSNGTFYFTSGESGHCQKQQKLRIAIGEGQEEEEEEETPTDAPSYQPAFGNIPSPASSSASLLSILTYLDLATAGFLACLYAIY